MRMPGFTGDTSLYETNNHYLARVRAETKGTISPAQMTRLGVPSAGFSIQEFLCESHPGCYWYPLIGQCRCIG